ncbi:MAG: NUDIX domain-containing protein, partial [Proteobacteria bacterium]
VEDGELPEEALLRELREEVGTDQVRILKRSEGTTFYLWPEHRRIGRVNHFDGQEHTWFLCEFLPGAGPRMDLADGTFRAAEWTRTDNVVGRNVDWKRPSMSLGLRHLGLVS